MYELVTFKQELEHTQAYLNIEQARFSERLKVNFDIDKKVEHVLLPPLTLQPLVENAIKHGLKNSQQEWMIDITLKNRVIIP